VLLHDFRRLRLQDRIGVIADQLAGVAHVPLQSRAYARPVYYRTWTRCRRLAAEQLSRVHGAHFAPGITSVLADRNLVDADRPRRRRAGHASDPIRTVRGTGHSSDERFGKDEHLNRSA
jgi:hypothetical protein